MEIHNLSVTMQVLVYFLFIDTTLPIECYPVIIFKKTSDAVPQTYNLPLPGQGSSRVTNLFGSTNDLLRVVCFPGDTVLDTSLDGKYSHYCSCLDAKVGRLLIYITI